MDKPFIRDFDEKPILHHLEDSRSLIHALFARWTLPGEPNPISPKPVPIRLALRDHAINFYANGQSAAELKIEGGEPRIKIAAKYLERAPVPFTERRRTDDYVTIAGDALLVGEADRLLDHIVAKSEKYWGEEKCFVEHLQARNANVLEVEMALPGDGRVLKMVRGKDGVMKPRKVAPRMDMVVMHLAEGGRPLIDFWEAKLATNGELRAEEGREPHILKQLASYSAWFAYKDRLEQVREAMQQSGVVLARLADRIGKKGPAVDLWNALGAQRPAINPSPAVVIGNYNPKCERFTPYDRRAQTFQDNGHHKRLVKEGVAIRPVSGITCKGGLFDTALAGERL